MPREDAHTKGRRYLTEGRLIITRIDHHTIDATCRGDGAIYQLGHRPGRGWWCTCPARGRCAHLLALGAVIAIERREGEWGSKLQRPRDNQDPAASLRTRVPPVAPGIPGGDR